MTQFRRFLSVFAILALSAILAPAAFAGCGEICNFMDCEPGEPEEGCIERPFFCLDMLCYSATPAACAAESASLEERIDAVIAGIDPNDQDALIEALAALEVPIRVHQEDGLVYTSPDYEFLKERNKATRRGEVTQIAATPEATPEG